MHAPDGGLDAPPRRSLLFALRTITVLVVIPLATAACGPTAPTPVVQPTTEATISASAAPVDWQVIREPAWGYEIAVPKEWMVVLATMDKAALAELAGRFPETQSAWLQSTTATLRTQGPMLRWIAVPPGLRDRQVEWELLPGVLDEQTTFVDWVEGQRAEAAVLGPIQVEEIHGPTHAVRILANDGLAIHIYLQRGEDVWEFALLCCGTPPDDVTIQAVLDTYRPIGP